MLDTIRAVLSVVAAVIVVIVVVRNRPEGARPFFLTGILAVGIVGACGLLLALTA